MRALAKTWRLLQRHPFKAALIAAAALLSGAEMVVVIVEPLVPMHWRMAFAALAFIVVVAALVARFIAARQLGAE